MNTEEIVIAIGGITISFFVRKEQEKFTCHIKCNFYICKKETLLNIDNKYKIELVCLYYFGKGGFNMRKNLQKAVGNHFGKPIWLIGNIL